MAEKKLSYSILFPVFAGLIVLPFFAIPFLDKWVGSLPTCIQAGRYCLDMVPPLTVGLKSLAGILKVTLWVGFLVGLVGLFSSLGRLADRAGN